MMNSRTNNNSASSRTTTKGSTTSSRRTFPYFLLLVARIVSVSGWIPRQQQHVNHPYQTLRRTKATSRDRLCCWLAATHDDLLGKQEIVSDLDFITDAENNKEHDGGDTATTAGRRTRSIVASSSSVMLSRRSAMKVSSVLSSSSFILSSLSTPNAANAYEVEEAKRISIFEKTSPSVVFIDTFAERRDAFTTNIMEVPLGSGSGFVWDKQGHIVTNFHVVRNAQSAQVAILLSGEAAKGVAPDDASSLTSSSSSSSSSRSGGGSIVGPSRLSRGSTGSSGGTGMVRKVYTARIVGVDPGKDCAVLKIDADENVLYPISVGTSTGIKVGQSVLAIGNPFGLDHTLTSGIISGTGREVRSPIGRPITNVLQTDAAINPGNSGGPLLDNTGKLIGMNTAIYSPSGASAGVGFALPVDTIRYIVETLIRDGKVVRPILGISYLGSKQARTLGITSGVLVLEVPPDSAAAKAGMKGTRRTESGLIEIGDIIVKVGDQVIDQEADLFQALEDLKPGDVVDVVVNRLVASNDELQIREKTLRIELSASTQYEKSFQFQEPRPMPMPMR